MTDPDYEPPLEERIGQLHGRWARVIRGLREDASPIEEADFHNEYCDYAMSCVTMALNKVTLALDYIKTIQRHPDYTMEKYRHSGDPVGMTIDYIRKQMHWVHNCHTSSLFNEMTRGNENGNRIRRQEWAKDRRSYDVLYSLFDGYRDDYLHYLTARIYENDTHEQSNARTDVLPKKLAHRAIVSICEEFCDVSEAQVDNAALLLDRLVNIYAAGKVATYPFLEETDRLTPAYVQRQLMAINNQMIQIAQARKVVIGHPNSKKPIFPVLHLQALDLDI